VTLTTETGNKHLVVLVDEVEATIIGHESGDLLAVLDELHADALPDGGVRLLGLNADLLKDDALGVGGASEGLGVLLTQVTLLVVLVSPMLRFAVRNRGRKALPSSHNLRHELICICAQMSCPLHEGWCDSYHRNLQ